MGDPAESTTASAPRVAIAEPFESTIEYFQIVEREDQAPGPCPSLLQGHRPSSSVMTGASTVRISATVR